MGRRFTGVLALALAAGLAVAGCGGGDDDADTGAASITPKEAPVYLDFTVRPEGEAAEDAKAALGKFLDTDDPGQKLITLVEQEAVAQGEDFDYEQQIEPWLGENFSIFLTTIGGDTTDSEGAFVFETTDVDKALEFFKQSGDATGRTAEYEGIEYEFDTDGDVLGAVDDFIVGGDEAGFKAAVDASKGDSLADADEFTDAVGDLPDDRLSTLYVPPEQFLNAIGEEEIDPQGRAIVEKVLGDFADQPILGDLTASADALSIELSAGGGGVATEESGLIESLPAEAWLGVGFSDIGATVQSSLEGVEQAGIPGFDATTIREQLRTQSGIDLEQDVIGPLGDAAFYLTGTTEANLGGALVIETSDPAASGQLVGKLQTLIQQQGKASGVKVKPLASATGDQGFQLTDPTGELKQPIQVVQRGERIVAGYGQASIDQALAGDSGAQTLASNPAFAGAKEAIGGLGLDAFLSFAPVLQFAEASGAAADPEYQRAKPYLDKLESVAVGSGAEDDRSLVRLVVGLTP